MIERKLVTGDIFTEEFFNEPAARVETRYWQVLDPSVDELFPKYKLSLSLRPLTLISEIKECAKLVNISPLARPNTVRFLPLNDKGWEQMNLLKSAPQE